LRELYAELRGYEKWLDENSNTLSDVSNMPDEEWGIVEEAEKRGEDLNEIKKKFMSIDLFSKDLMDKIMGELKRYWRYVHWKYEAALQGEEEEDDDYDTGLQFSDEDEDILKPDKEEKKKGELPPPEMVIVPTQVQSQFYAGINSLLKSLHDLKISDKKT